METGNHIYMYKNKAEVLPLAMVDDLVGVASCGFESVALNSFINTQIELKKLRFHTPDVNGKSKCNVMHIGINSGVHGSNMNLISHDTYLGDIIMSNGSNELNIQARASKGQGKVTDIMNILEKVTLGSHFFKVAKLLRESIFFKWYTNKFRGVVWGVPKTSGPIGVCGQVIVEKILGHLCDNSNGGYSTRIWSAK